MCNRVDRQDDLICGWADCPFYSSDLRNPIKYDEKSGRSHCVLRDKAMEDCRPMCGVIAGELPLFRSMLKHKYKLGGDFPENVGCAVVEQLNMDLKLKQFLEGILKA